MVRVSLQRIASHAGLSKMTVSRALRDAPEVSAATRARVKKISVELGYESDIRVSNVMASFRRSETPSYRETLGFIVTHSSWMADAEAHAAARAALENGYQIDVIHAWEHGNGGAKLARVLDARGIRGVILAPNSSSDRPRFDLPWERFSAVLLGNSLVNEGLPRVRPAHFQGTCLAVRKTLELGYRRVAMLVDHSLNERTGRALSGAFLAGAHEGGIKWADRALHFRNGGKDKSWQPWLDRLQPDALIVEGRHRFPELEAHVGSIPGSMAVTVLSTGDREGVIAGVDQNWQEISRVAVSMLTSCLRSERRGLNELASVTTIPGTWRDGRSAPGARQAGE